LRAKLEPGATVAGWARSGERSNRLALRFMAWFALTLGRRAARWLLLPITLYFLLFSPAARRHSGRYLQRVLGRPPSWGERWRHFHSFSSVVLDRVYFVRGRMDLFDLQISGEEFIDEDLQTGRGVLLLGAHIGSFEALHAVGASRPGLRVAMVMYPDNAEKIHSVLQAVAPDFKLGIIPIGRSGSSLAVRDWLDSGGLVGLLGDRHLGPALGAGIVELPFLGRTVGFTDGPLRLAQLLRRRVLFMSALYRGGNRYEMRFEPLADFSKPGASVTAALQAYVSRLESLVAQAPFNWFNFFDYWRED
jgi:hypothetical protein